ncbi:MAG TPA: glycosyltransferase family 4 protein [Longimicrobiales bacterium]
MAESIQLTARVQVRVLYIVTAYARHEGDVITPWMTETIHRLRREGVTAEVLAPAYRGSGSGEVGGVRVHRFRYAPRRWEDLTHDQTAPDRVRERPAYLGLVPGYVLAGMRAAARLAVRERFDVVHVHWPIPHALFGLAARRAAGTPLVLTFHGVELTWTQRRWPVLTPLLRRFIRTADAVTANSTYTAELIRRVYDREVVRLPFGATVEAPEAGPAAGAPEPEPAPRSAEDPAPRVRPTASAEPSAPPSAPPHRAASSRSAAGPRPAPPDSACFELLFVGRLVERKGVHYLLEALARLRPGRCVHLRVVGDGPMRGALEARARELGLADRVHFDGFVSRADLARRFASCDAFVLPAIVDAKGDTEGLGVVLVEALTYGKPVIASAAGGITDVIRDGETGVLVPPADAGALAHAIEALAADPARARALGAAGRVHVEREFSWPVIIDRLVSLYRGLAARDG